MFLKDELISKETFELFKKKSKPTDISSDYDGNISQSLLQKWLREKHKTHITIQRVVGNKGTEKETISWTITNSAWETYSTYEEALEEGLKEALKLIKK